MKKNIFSLLVVVSFSQVSFSQSVFFTKPYLQLGHNANLNSLELLWHTTEAEAEWQVEYRNTSKDKWSE